MLCLFCISVKAHAYGGRPVAKPQPSRQTSYFANRPGPGTYSYVRPAAGSSAFPRPAASKYAASSAAIPSTTISSSSYESRYVTTESFFYNAEAATTSGYYAEPIYYPAEPSTYYATTPASSYADSVYSATEQQPTSYGGASSSQYYTYVDPGTYFVQDAAAPTDYYTTAPAVNNYAGPAAGDYVAGPATDAYADPSAYYTVDAIPQQYGVYNTESGSVYNGQPGYYTGSDVVYGTDNVPNNDYTTAVPVYYSEQAAATLSPYIAADVQYAA